MQRYMTAFAEHPVRVCLVVIQFRIYSVFANLQFITRMWWSTARIRWIINTI